MQKLLLVSICIHFLFLNAIFGQFGEPELTIPHDTYLASINLADLNGDGHEDLIGNSPFAWYEGKGKGIYDLQHKLGNQTDDILSKIEMEDFDQDGDLDIMVAEKYNKTLRWYENDGQGNFEVSHIVSNTLEFPQDFATNDWDNDGDIDIIVTIASGWTGDENGSVLKFENNGEGEFSSDGSVIFGSERGFRKVFLKDLNNNGYADIVVNHTGNGVLIFINLGEGYFNTNQDTGQINELPLYEVPYSHNAHTFEATFVDFNNDGFLDIIPQFGNYENIVWYENNQSGRFLKSHLIAALGFDDLVEVSAGDLDNDGDTDLVFGASGISWLENLGNGNFGEKKEIRFQAGVYRLAEIVIKDLNEDGYMDLFISDDRLTLHWVEGSADLSFENRNHIFLDIEDCIIDDAYNWEDVNGDGFNDLIFFDSEDNRLFWLENNGIGDFSVPKTLISDFPKLYYYPILHFVDINGDNRKDLIVGEVRDENTVISYLNEGGANFTKFQEIDLSGITGAFNSIDSNDFDKDGGVDLILAPRYSYPGTHLILAVNDGTGFFNTQSVTIPEQTNCVKLIAADLNNDGWTDIFVQGEEVLHWIENHGDNNFGTLTEIGRFDNISYAKTQLKDFDGDGYLDVMASVSSTDLQRYLYIYKNKEGLSFSTRDPILQTELPIKDWAFKDLDQDNDKDLIINTEVTGTRFNDWWWYENKGGNHFSKEIFMFSIESFYQNSQSIVIEDMDYDGDNDLLISDGNNHPLAFFVENYYNLKLNITGYAFGDKNENGLYDEGEVPLIDQRTHLEPTSNALFTNSEGRFFYSVYPGDYSLTYQESTLWERTTPDKDYGCQNILDTLKT